jgi:PadR family transcriptional regulator PadR
MNSSAGPGFSGLTIYCTLHTIWLMPEYLGEFEQLVLLALARLGDDAYGVTIRDTLRERAGREVSFGAIYSTLRRLEAKGLVSSALGEPEPIRGGRAKKFVAILPRGRAALAEAQRAFKRMSEGLREI